MSEIKWRQWGPQAFDDARREGKLVLLDISAVWCHWCHVMDASTYGNGEVADCINKNFIPVRVDNDLRPEINERYNMGGWPTTAFLTPEGYVLHGGTYFTPEQFLALADGVRKIYAEKKTEIDRAAIPLEKDAPPREAVKSEEAAGLYQKIIDSTALLLDRIFDPLYGGFGWQPKFPHADALRFLMFHHRCTGAEISFKMLDKTLRQMGGGMYDKVENGFFRYSTMPDWSVPHFEKMLQDNAELLALYCDMRLLTGDEFHRSRAAGIAAYMIEKLYDPKDGGFSGSQDADEEYYRLGLGERRNRTAPAIDRRKFADWNSLAAVGMFKAAAVTGDASFHDAAVKTLTYIRENLVDARLNVRHVEGGEAPGLLRDHVEFALACLAAHAHTGEEKRLGDCVMIAQAMLGGFWDGEKGGLFDTGAARGPIGHMKYRLKSNRDNARAAELFIRIHLATGDEKYGFLAAQILEALYGRNSEPDPETPPYAYAAMMITRPHLVVKVGGRRDKASKEWLAAVNRIYEPRMTVRFAAEKGGEPSAMICNSESCMARVAEPSEIAPALRRILNPDSPR